VNTETGPKILVVDDTPTNVTVLLGHLNRAGYKVLVAADGTSAIEQARYARPDLILLDVMMPGLDGYRTCERLKDDARTSSIPVIFMTALDEVEDKIKAFAAGGVDHITKPFHAEEVLVRVRTHLELQRLRCELEAANAGLERRVAERTTELNEALDELRELKSRVDAENAYLQQELADQANPAEIVGDSPALRATLAQVRIVAPSDVTVLIHGETGTGKELVARAVHLQSPRRERPLVKLNCAAISAGLVESELFGHVKGAFTGATDRRVGRFELADGGTLFLDEVSELPLDTQTKLLRVLQEREFEPVGSSKTQHVDVRVIAATNRDLSVDVERGRFRADLYYRLNVFPVNLPALRERPEDIPRLAAFFMQRAARKMGKRLDRIEPETLQRLVSHSWPGNVRDLQNVIERAVILSQGRELEVDWELGPGVRTTAPPIAADFGAASANASLRVAAPAAAEVLSLEELERRHFVSVLRRTRGVIEGPNGAAKLLDLKPSTARFRIRKLGIQRADYLVD
jgi:formate hydrogenlyase transcriptional activator